ncbi:MAG: hypothetical protein AAF518_20985 [Spirochaetota bacterium]
MMRTLLLFFLISLVSFLPAEPVEDAPDATSGSKGSVDGVADATWGMSFDSLRDHFIKLQRDPKSEENIEIVHEIYNKRLHVKRNGIDYFYRFYTTPKLVKNNRQGSEKKTDKPDLQEPSNLGASLYSVGIKFNNLESYILKTKLIEKYGNPTKQVQDVSVDTAQVEEEEEELTLADAKPAGGSPEVDTATATATKKPEVDLKKERNYAAFVWDLSEKQKTRPDDANKELSGTFIIQWNEPYQQNRYSRRLDYFSAKLTATIAQDYKDYYSAREIRTLTDLLNGLK